MPDAMDGLSRVCRDVKSRITHNIVTYADEPIPSRNA